MISEKLVHDGIAYARSESQKYGFPTSLHFDLSLAKAEEVATKLGANVRLAMLGAALMDIKLGEAFQQGRLAEHVQIGTRATADFLKNYELDPEEVAKIINCVEAHHGAVPHSCLESQIATNADCYRFIHPVGVLSYIGTLSKRNPDFVSVVKAAKEKLEEKQQLLTLEICKQELDKYYRSFKEMFAAARAMQDEMQHSTGVAQ